MDHQDDLHGTFNLIRKQEQRRKLAKDAWDRAKGLFFTVLGGLILAALSWLMAKWLGR